MPPGPGRPGIVITATAALTGRLIRCPYVPALAVALPAVPGLTSRPATRTAATALIAGTGGLLTVRSVHPAGRGIRIPVRTAAAARRVGVSTGAARGLAQRIAASPAAGGILARAPARGRIVGIRGAGVRVTRPGIPGSGPAAPAARSGLAPAVIITGRRAALPSLGPATSSAFRRIAAVLPGLAAPQRIAR